MYGYKRYWINSWHHYLKQVMQDLPVNSFGRMVHGMGVLFYFYF